MSIQHSDIGIRHAVPLGDARVVGKKQKAQSYLEDALRERLLIHVYSRSILISLMVINAFRCG